MRGKIQRVAGVKFSLVPASTCCRDLDFLAHPHPSQGSARDGRWLGDKRRAVPCRSQDRAREVRSPAELWRRPDRRDPAQSCRWRSSKVRPSPVAPAASRSGELMRRSPFSALGDKPAAGPGRTSPHSIDSDAPPSEMETACAAGAPQRSASKVANNCSRTPKPPRLIGSAEMISTAGMKAKNSPTGTSIPNARALK